MLACGRASRRPSRTRGTSRPPSWGCRASASSQPRGSMPCPNYHTYIPPSMISHADCKGRRRAQRLQQRRVLVQQQQRVKPSAPHSSLVRMLCSRLTCAACMCMCVDTTRCFRPAARTPPQWARRWARRAARRKSPVKASWGELTVGTESLYCTCTAAAAESPVCLRVLFQRGHHIGRRLFGLQPAPVVAEQRRIEILLRRLRNLQCAHLGI